MNLELVRVKERVFPALDAPQRYRSAKVWHCNFRSLAPLAEFTGLRDLEIATYPDESLELLSGLGQLRRLRIIHLPKVSSLEPLGRLDQLRELALSTLPSWDASHKRTQVDSFQPLSHLHHLESLELAGITAAKGGLAPLRKLTALRSVRLGNDFTIHDFAGLRASNPRLEGQFLAPTVELSFSRCSRCGTARVMLSGVAKYNIKCPKCQAQRVSRHLAEWRDAEKAAG